MKKSLLYTFIFVSAVYSAVVVQAVGLSVSPKELKFLADVGETVSQKLKVKNPSGEVSIFEVYPDDLGALVKISPASFILESEEEKEVTVQVTPKEEGIFKTNISVVASPVASSSFNAGSGVKIPLEISAGESGPWFAALISLPFSGARMLGIMLLFLIVVSVFLVIRYGVKQIKS